MNTYYMVSCLLAFAVVTFASVIPPAYVPLATVEKIPSSNYGFHYAVNDPSTGDNKAQWETRHGDIVQGAYSLVEPDGNVRLVEYHADPIHGFNAIVKRTGPNILVHNLPTTKPIAPIIAEPIGPFFEPHVPIAPTKPIEPILAKPLGLYIEPHVPIGPTKPIVPIVAKPLGPFFEPHVPIAPLVPITPDAVHQPIVAPVIDLPHYPLLPALDYRQILPAKAPWVNLSGRSYGHKGNIVREYCKLGGWSDIIGQYKNLYKNEALINVFDIYLTSHLISNLFSY